MKSIKMTSYLLESNEYIAFHTIRHDIFNKMWRTTIGRSIIFVCACRKKINECRKPMVHFVNQMLNN